MPLACLLSIAASLRIGQSLGENEIAALQDRTLRSEPTNERCAIWPARPRSTAEVRRNLERQASAGRDGGQVIQRLSAAGYLDDEAFAQFLGEQP